MAKTILITGCSTGLGFAAARAFAERGYRVIATVRREADASRVEAECKRSIHPVLCDVTVKEQVAELPGAVRRITGDGVLDGLINNAGILHVPCPVEFQKMEDIRAVFDVNVFGMMAVTIALLPVRWQISRATSGVKLSPGRRPIIFRVPFTLLSESSLRNGDCSS